VWKLYAYRFTIDLLFLIDCVKVTGLRGRYHKFDALSAMFVFRDIDRIKPLKLEMNKRGLSVSLPLKTLLLPSMANPANILYGYGTNRIDSVKHNLFESLQPYMGCCVARLVVFNNQKSSGIYVSVITSEVESINRSVEFKTLYI
jgi:hypothetical protein